METRVIEFSIPDDSVLFLSNGVDSRFIDLYCTRENIEIVRFSFPLNSTVDWMNDLRKVMRYYDKTTPVFGITNLLKYMELMHEGYVPDIVKEAFHLGTSHAYDYVLPPKENYLAMYNSIHLPLYEYSKADIIHNYFLNEWEDELWKTISCTKLTDSHCGDCFACQHRHDSFLKLSIDDKTVYNSDNVLNRKPMVRYV